MNTVYGAIASCDSEDYSAELKNGYDWPMFYHLSKMRQSLINWYEFYAGWRVLELRGELGALTGVLCNHCREVVTLVTNQEDAETLKKRYIHRQNLDVCIGTIDDIADNNKFDLILDVCGLETVSIGNYDKIEYVNYINKIAEKLTEDGKLLTVVENRYGIKYFCGEREKYSRLPFFGINQCFEEKGGHLFHKREIEEILDLSNLKQYKFYYPLPDHICPQIIFTDEYSSGTLVSERLNPYHVEQDTLIASDRRIYRDVINNGALEFMANSFLIECGLKNNMSNIISAVVSTDRNERESFATCVHSNAKVSKINLFPEGKENVNHLYENIRTLALRGIKTIEHKICNDRIEMPYIDKKRLSDVMLDVVNRDEGKFIELWDRLYSLIKLSSNGRIVDDDYILDKVYLDLVPGNIFVIDDEFYVFDQEFIKENYSAKYALYRGIKYFYMALGATKPLVSIEGLRQRYSLDKQWEEFEIEERIFIASNRQEQLYAQYNKWANCNRWDIARRGERIGQLSGERIQ